MFRKNSCIENFQAKEGEASRFCRNFFISQDRKISPGNHSVFQKISVREKYFMDKRGGGKYQDFPSKIFCLTVPKISVGGILYCCNNFRCRKSLDKGGGGITIFRRSFCLTVQKY